ncbi:MAG: hypothetical protein JRE88_07780 [Deltaproteobacteria bacterium]|jgi:hypothetical protein|nr:hypothetical protein [Deltaproteobacteria bacterium]MBW2516666.1 hypothetical protein [Deltaproteobacteria bacterium]
MALNKIANLQLSDQDLDFLIEAAASGVGDKANLKKILREDKDFRNSFVSDEKVFNRLMADDEIFLKISPSLFFEILLRKAIGDLSKTSYTLEKTRNMSIPVFDTRELVALLNDQPIVAYLANMLSTFTRIESYSIAFRIRKGFWRKIRFNDMDITSLIRFSEAIEDEYRLGLYKRIADVCLFILGIFPDYAERNYRYPLSGEIRPQIGAGARISPEEYEQKGQQFYRLAAEHQTAVEMDLSDVFWALHENFQKARKPLNFIADYYLTTKRHRLFG